MHTYPTRVVLQRSASSGFQLIVSRSGSVLLVLPALPLETWITADREGRSESAPREVIPEEEEEDGDERKRR
ncbi:hypothetical protein F7725_009065 [Dissostichus mawsoni]|uniref:Uncharacterized protein n=1 Tax=Dissostichus mawsoni TaxID=36200 RepID=A0A7J5Z6F3_DISMA|nr:hypothetical protein F7725_009065 [Dissostichus mawsoni]